MILKIIPELTSEIIHYLGLIERLKWSSVNKGYRNKICRQEIHSKVSAIRITHYLEWCFSDGCSFPPKINSNMIYPLNNPTISKNLSEDIKLFFEGESNSTWGIRILSDEMLKLHNIHTCSFYFQYRKVYKQNKSIISQDIWDPQPIILKNQNICAIYRCRKIGLLRRKILKSLVLKALVN